MALTVTELWAAIRQGDGTSPPPEPQLGIVSRMMTVAIRMAAQYAPDAPDDVADQAVVNVVAYLYDSNPAGGRNLYTNAMTQSGAAALLDQFRVPRARPIGGRASSSTPTPSGDLTAIERRLATLEGEVEELEAGGSGLTDEERTALTDNTAFVAAQPAVDEAQDERLTTLEDDFESLTTGTGTAASWAEAGNLSRIPKTKLPTDVVYQAALDTVTSQVGTLQTEIQANTANIAAVVRQAIANTQALTAIGLRLDGLGDWQAVAVRTAASYSNTLDSQAASAMPLVLVVTADITGNRAGTAFDWDAGDVILFGPMDVTPELLFNLDADSTADLTGYRTAAAQDIIDSRATAGILAARTDARTADGKAVAAQEDADNNTARLNTLDGVVALNTAKVGITTGQANAITANSAAKWTGQATTVPAYITTDQGAFTLRAILLRASGTFPTGARMRINASGRNGSLVAADDEGVATLGFTSTQARTVVQNAANGIAGGNPRLLVYESNGTTLIESLPLLIPVVPAQVKVSSLANEAAYNAITTKDANTIYYVAA